MGVFPITNNYVISLFSSNVGAGKREDQVNFFISDCTTRKVIIESNSVKLIITPRKLECDFLKIVYNKGINVYEVV